MRPIFRAGRTFSYINMYRFGGTLYRYLQSGRLLHAKYCYTSAVVSEKPLFAGFSVETSYCLVDGTDVSDQYTASIFRLKGSSNRGLCIGTDVSEEHAASTAKGLSDQEIPSRVTSLRFFAVFTLSKTSCPPHSQAMWKRV